MFGCEAVGISHFLFLHGAHESGTRFLRRTTLNCPSGDWTLLLDAVADGGVGVMFSSILQPNRIRYASPPAEKTSRGNQLRGNLVESGVLS